MTSPELERHSIYVVGAGRVGAALAGALRRGGGPVAGLWSRSEATARQATAVAGLDCRHGALPAEVGQATVVIVAVSDPAVPVVAGALLDGGLLRRAEVVLHCGGARPAAEALGVLGASVAVGTLHPLVAVARADLGLELMGGAWFAVEGAPAARQVAAALARAAGGTPFCLRAEAMAVYHAAAVLASNHAVVLWEAAARLLVRGGLSGEQAHAALMPLLASTLANQQASGVGQGLTGPVRRGDVATVERHLEALAAHAPEVAELYRAASRAAVAAAARLEVDPLPADAADRMLKLLK